MAVRVGARNRENLLSLGRSKYRQAVDRFAFFYQLWPDPPVFVIASGLTIEHGVALALAHAGGRESHVLVRPSWAMAAHAHQVVTADQWLKTNQPHLRLTAMAPSGEEALAWEALGVNALHAHNLAFIDEAIFRPDPDAPKLYGAVHTAQTAAFKRHELALGVPDIALITYVGEDGAESVASLRARYRSLAFVNEGMGLTPWQVRDVLVRAHCGLVLSAEEGPNNATMEYFLCGIPLVSTSSIGGRDAMYEPGHVALVPPAAAAVEAAVASFVARAPDPGAIRAAALAKTRAHRERMIAWLSAIAGRDLFSLADSDLWLPQFCDKMREFWVLRPQGDGQAIAHCLSRPDRPRAAASA